ncbi:MAG: peptidoglycan DD-metalloendopeptidase family protein [Neomegalonema sp.]|nr:peptidoglycan DD-metalloendopeptidase family protein [Neomegalonema sp.]
MTTSARSEQTADPYDAWEDLDDERAAAPISGRAAIAALCLITLSFAVSVAVAEAPGERTVALEAQATAAAAAAAAKREATRARRNADELKAEGEALTTRIRELGELIVAREDWLASADERVAAMRRDIANAESRLAVSKARLAQLTAAFQRVAREPTPALLSHPGRPQAAARSHAQLRAMMRLFHDARRAAKRDLKLIAERRLSARRTKAASHREKEALRAEIAESTAILKEKRVAELAERKRASAEAKRASKLILKAKTLAELAVALAEPPKPDPEQAQAAEPARPPEAPTQATARRPEIAAAPKTAPRPQPRPAKEPIKTADISPAQPESTRQPPPRTAAKAKPRPKAAAPEDHARKARERRIAKARLFRGPFAKARGKLLRPAIGQLRKVTASDGVPGAIILTRPHARVIAPWSGVVQFADSFKSHNVVIIKPQKGYAIIFNGLGEVTVRKGERIEAGQIIGRMPGSAVYAGRAAAGSAREELYIELLARRSPIDPAPWFDRKTKEVGGL